MNAATAFALLLCLLSALAYATAAVQQERLARRTPPGGPTRGRLRVLLSGGAWWWSAGLNTLAALLHAAALRYGPLTLVQPLGALTLVAAVPLGARIAGRRVRRTEWRGTLLTLAGLALLLLPSSGPAPEETLSVTEAFAVGGAGVVLIGLLAARRDPGTGLRHATASGLASAVGSALTQTVAVAIGRGTWTANPWRVAGFVLLILLFAIGGLLLAQRAYQGGLGAPLAMVNLANPLAAAAIGMILLGERLGGGPLGIALALAGAALATRGVVLLTHTPTAPPAPDRTSRPTPLTGAPRERAAPA
ncbi:DMT family transporter [Streptomyces sp. BI20]|uniref:DMT family transporter n=1 Tax=Streptomyces sp. BI20 TaxID=3403460 RepID=UPI003C77B453